MKNPVTYNLLMYDITHDKTLQKVAKILQKSGYERINYSVWLGLKSLKEDPKLRMELQKLLRKPEAAGSRLYSLPIKKHTLKNLRSITGHLPSNLDYWLGERSQIFF